MTNKVLLIDDEPNTLSTLSAVISHAGFEVISAVDGQSGLARARRDRPDLIVCDMQMPPPDGMALRALLALDPLTAEIPFIFLTSCDSDGDKVAGLASGADDYITKPCRPAELIERIRAVLRRHERGRRRGHAEASEQNERLWHFLYETAQLVGREGQHVEQLELSTTSEAIWHLQGRADFEARLDNQEYSSSFPLAIACFQLQGLRMLREPAADQLLRQILNRLSGLLDDDTLLFRLGPEQFAVLMPQAAQRLDGLKEILRSELASAHDSLGTATPHLGMSVEIAQSEDRLSTILHQAEDNMKPTD